MLEATGWDDVGMDGRCEDAGGSQRECIDLWCLEMCEDTGEREKIEREDDGSEPSHAGMNDSLCLE